MTRRLILASRSPRRLMLLKSVGYVVEVKPSQIDESARAGESVVALVERLSREKAAACVGQLEDQVIVAADTLVAIDDQLLGQPADLSAARVMLQQLSGRTHTVTTGLCVRQGAQVWVDHCATTVHFRALSEAEIDCYLAHNDVLDKAGGYAIQGGAASFIDRIDGPLDNVIGLPMRLLATMLARCEERC